jgi:hypothetical protein
MNPELQALEKMLQMGLKSKADLAGLDEQHATASALRDTPDYKGNSRGQQSIFGHLANTVQKNTGKRQLKELAGQREAARANVANTASALPMYNAKVAAAKAAQDQTNFESTAAATIEAARKKAELEANIRNAKGSEMVKVSPDGKERTVLYNPETRKAYLNGEVIDNFGDWTDPATKTKAMTGAGGYGGQHDDKDSRRFSDAIRNADHVYSLMADMSPEQEEMLNSGAYRTKMAALETLAPEKFTALVKSEFSGYDDATRKMMIKLNLMSGEERNRLFGSALTKPELMSSQEFMANTIGKGMGFVRDALQTTKHTNIDNLLGVDAQYNGDVYYRRMVSQGLIPEGYTPTTFGLGQEPALGSNVPAPEIKEAPPAALDMLSSNPELAADFKAKYGYLPEGATNGG